MRVRVEDGRGGEAVIAVTVAVTDLEEPPGAPGAPAFGASTADRAGGELAGAGQQRTAHYRLRGGLPGGGERRLPGREPPGDGAKPQAHGTEAGHSPTRRGCGPAMRRGRVAGRRRGRAGRPRRQGPGVVRGVGLVGKVEALEVIWTAAEGADGYKVQWRTEGQGYDESRQAVVSGGQTLSYTIRGLTEGRTYMVRVIATRRQAPDGEPSEEISGTPALAPPEQVGRVEVSAQTEALEVRWTAAANADGYKVQWRLGNEAYDETRQAVVGATTLTYTIRGLTPGAGLPGAGHCNAGGRRGCTAFGGRGGHAAG